MPRPGYLNFAITADREAMLDVLCQDLRMEPSHRTYTVAVDFLLKLYVYERANPAPHAGGRGQPPGGGEE